MVPAIFTLLRLCPRTFAPASYLLPLSLSLSAIFDPYPSLGLLHEEPYTSSASKKERERATRERNEKRKTEEIYRLQESPWFPTLVKLPRLRTPPDDWQPLFLSFSHLLYPPSILLLTTYVCCASLLSPPRFFKIGRPDEIRSSPLLASLSLPLSFSLSLREWGLSQTHPLLENARFLSRILFHRGRNLGQTREKRREERKKANVSFPNDPRTIHKLWKMSQPSRV